MLLEVEHLRFWYRPDRVILEDISLGLGKGDILCLLGPNGTGKTTLLRCLLGLNRQKQGGIQVEGRNIAGESVKQRAKLFAYVPQSTGLTFPYEALEVVLMGRTAHLLRGAAPSRKDYAVSLECMERLGIGWMAGHLFQELSGGERQMVLVARALAQQASILVMDEPTANLDYSNQVKMLRTINELSGQGYSILMTSHFPDHAFLACNKVALMRDGHMMAVGHPEKVVTSEKLTKLYGTPVRVAETVPGTENEVVKVCIPLMKIDRVQIDNMEEVEHAV